MFSWWIFPYLGETICLLFPLFPIFFGVCNLFPACSTLSSSCQVLCFFIFGCGYSHFNPSFRNFVWMNKKLGDRCQVEPGKKKGVVMFVGHAETLASGFWVGVQSDEPLGKHDRLVKGKRYFECPPFHGAIVRPGKVKVVIDALMMH